MSHNDLLTVVLMLCGLVCVLMAVGNLLVGHPQTGVFLMILGVAIFWLAFMQMADPGFLPESALASLIQTRG